MAAYDQFLQLFVTEIHCAVYDDMVTILVRIIHLSGPRAEDITDSLILIFRQAYPEKLPT